MRVPLEGPPTRITPFVLGMGGGGGEYRGGGEGEWDKGTRGQGDKNKGRYILGRELIPDPELSRS